MIQLTSELYYLIEFVLVTFREGNVGSEMYLHASL